MNDPLRDRYEQDYGQMAQMPLWNRILEHVSGMEQAMTMSISETNDFQKFLVWRGELSGIRRVLSFLKDPLKKLAKNQTGQPEKGPDEK